MHYVEPLFNIPETAATPDPNSLGARVIALEARLAAAEARLAALESRPSTAPSPYQPIYPVYPCWNASMAGSIDTHHTVPTPTSTG